MDKALTLKSAICTASGVVGSWIAWAFGGWTSDLTTLVFFMAIDFITGIIVALLCKSKKTESGGLSSGIGLQGISKKVVTLFLVMVAYRIDLTLGIDYVKTTAIIAFIVNEVISIAENAGLLGLPMPSILKKAIDILKGKAEEDKKDDDDENNLQG